jgi:UDP-N-acetylmuramoyl-L-alanyl-D-glutamate--2,6-diaminopimelate ligase
VRSPAGEAAVELPLRGRFNAANALVALAAGDALGVSLGAMAEALRTVVPVPGRVQAVTEGQDFAVLVDYAHKPGALEKVLAAARELAAGRVIAVFGAGGDRDRAKRPVMGEIAARLADSVIVTSDNPRSEPPEAITDEILAGVPAEAFHVKRQVDRRAAIEQAIAEAVPGDVVVIAGKGHEQGQEFAGGRKEPFDDVEVARAALRAARAAPSEGRA